MRPELMRGFFVCRECRTDQEFIDQHFKCPPSSSSSLLLFLLPLLLLLRRILLPPMLPLQPRSQG